MKFNLNIACVWLCRGTPVRTEMVFLFAFLSKPL